MSFLSIFLIRNCFITGIPMLYHFSPCSFPQRLSSYWKYAGYKNCLGFGYCLSIEVCVVTEWDAVTFCCLSQPHFPFPFSTLSLKLVHLRGESGEGTGFSSQKNLLLIWLPTQMLLWAQESEQQCASME